ncbi:hypothetical protein [Deinococcus sp.]|uniref:hypothetical protein n=1 Tax=Deinococcus sp. TaxID=47478 RepID=UPI003B58F64A
MSSPALKTQFSAQPALPDVQPEVQKVHVTLRPEVCRSPEDLQQTLELIEDRAGLISANPRRAQRYGIVTGEMDTRRLAELEAVPGVQSVTVDGLKHAL